MGGGVAGRERRELRLLRLLLLPPSILGERVSAEQQARRRRREHCGLLLLPLLFFRGRRGFLMLLSVQFFGLVLLDDFCRARSREAESACVEREERFLVREREGEKK